MKYRSLSLSGFTAVQVDFAGFDPIKSHRWRRTKPDWFQSMMDSGHLAPVKNGNDCYISLTNSNSTFKCYQGDYIIRNPKGLVFWMPKSLFEESFTPDTGRYGLSHKQQAVLDFIIAQHESPSVREIMHGLGYNSTSVVKRHLDRLKERGYIDFMPGRARSIVVL